jgi:hypothetical protein
VQQLLVSKKPGLFDAAPDVPAKPPARPPAKDGAGGDRTAGSAAPAATSTAAAAGQAGSAANPAAQVVVPAADPPPAAQDPSPWTPDVIMLMFKEIVTALLALAIVGFTLLMAWNMVALAGDTTRLNNAKDLLLLMLSLAGVAVGYYFGRVPADARASQAQQQAASATEHRAQVSAAADNLARQVDEIVPRAAATRAAGAAMDDESMAQLQRMRAAARQLSMVANQHR